MSHLKSPRPCPPGPSAVSLALTVQTPPLGPRPVCGRSGPYGAGTPPEAPPWTARPLRCRKSTPPRLSEAVRP